MVEFISKFQGRGFKIDRVNTICIAKSLIFANISLSMEGISISCCPLSMYLGLNSDIPLAT